MGVRTQEREGYEDRSRVLTEKHKVVFCQDV